MRGRFITFEGPEGSGKSTQAGRLASRLRQAGLPVVTTREPGGTPTGELIRDVVQHDLTGEPICAEAEVLLFAASRAQLVRRVIRPALTRGDWVISDRFADSTTAYQGFGRGQDIARILEINALAIGESLPDRTLLMDVDVATGFERLRQRHESGEEEFDRIEREEKSFHERVRQGYLDLARRWPERFRVFDTSEDEDAVHERIWEAVRELMP